MARTGHPARCRAFTSPFQLEASAQAPCTMTTVGLARPGDRQDSGPLVGANDVRFVVTARAPVVGAAMIMVSATTDTITAGRRRARARLPAVSLISDRPFARLPSP